MSLNKEILAIKKIESPSPRLIFAHLFPGNNYDDLPKSSLDSSFLLLKLDTVENLIRLAHIPKALADESHFAQRVDFDKLSKQVVNKKLKDLEFLDKAHHPVMFKCHQFGDLVDRRKGERLAGVAVKKAHYLFRREIILGVVDKFAHPVALIYFLEGKSPRQSQQIEKTLRGFGLAQGAIA